MFIFASYSISGEADISSESRVVTPAKVYNWFANRRKDANRRKRMWPKGENIMNTNKFVTFSGY